MYAAAQGNLEAVRKLVETFKFDPRYLYNGLSPLHCAVAYGHMEIVKYLVDEKGCSPETESSQEFSCTDYKAADKRKRKHSVVLHGIPSSLLFVCKLTDHYKSVSKYSLNKRAIEINHIHIDILKFLFDNGWKYDKQTHIFSRKETPLFYILKFIMNFANVPDLAYLVDHNHLSLGEIKQVRLLENVIADSKSNVEILKYLIGRGALCVTVEILEHVACKISDEVCMCLLEHCTEDVYSTPVSTRLVERMGRREFRGKVLLDYSCKCKLPFLSEAIAQRNLNSQDSAW